MARTGCVSVIAITGDFNSSIDCGGLVGAQRTVAGAGRGPGDDANREDGPSHPAYAVPLTPPAHDGI